MGKEEKYIVPLKDLEIGTYEFHYQLDDEFFALVNGPEIQKGNVNSDVEIKKSGHAFFIHFKMDGTIKVLCDRCMGEMDQPIFCEEDLTVKFGDDKSEEDDKLVIISEEDGEIDLSWYMYEFIALHIPIRHVHETGECDEETEKALRKHLAFDRNETDESDGDSLASEAGNDETETGTERETDPRWDALKKLIDNN